MIGKPMLRLPLFVVYAMIAFNITAFTVLLQMDILIFHSIIAKFIAWTFSVGAWWWTYIKRDQFIELF